ncbi:MAG: O-antigen ligase family protein [Candidatus Shapirobacteria bacterium]
MAPVSTILYGLTLLSFLVGNLWRPQLGSLSVPLIDIALALTSVFIIWQNRFNLKKINYLVLIFIILSGLNLLIQSLPDLSLTPFLYWLRFSLWFMAIFLAPTQVVPPKLIFLGFGGFILIGFFQYFFYPDLRPLTCLNWDPHLYRLVGSLLDPAFTGLCLLLFLILLITQPNLIRFQKFVIVLSYLALALTYSRATFLSLIIFALYYSIHIKKATFFVKTLLLVALTLILLPRPPGEGTKLERTSTIAAKIVNYRQAIGVLTSHPIVGIGYNRIGYFRPQETSASHARWGFDNSFLNIAIGNGLPMLLFFLYLLLNLWKSSTAAFKCLLIAVFSHSFFSNSLIYPQIMAFLLLFKYRK